MLFNRRTGQLDTIWYQDHERISHQVQITRLDSHHLKRYVISVDILPTDLWEDGVREEQVAPLERDPWLEADQNGEGQDDVIEWLPDEPSGSRETESAENQDEQVAAQIPAQRNTEPNMPQMW